MRYLAPLTAKGNAVRYVAVLAVAVLLGACSEPRVDASSDSALKVSLQKVRSSLNAEHRAEFDAIVAQGGFAAAMSSAFTKDTLTLTSIFQPMDGKTGTEVIAAFRADEARKEAAQMAKDQDELAELERKVAAREDALAKIQTLKISNPRVQSRQIGFSTYHELFATVRNTLDRPLSKLKFTYSLKSPERAVPWNADEGYFFIDGGLEPGEEREIQASAGGFSTSGFILLSKAMREHNDATLALTITDAAGADKSSLVPGELGAYEIARLAQLKAKRTGVTKQ